MVVRTDEGLEGPCEVYAESALCELLGDYVVETHLVKANEQAALAAVLAGTRWNVGEVQVRTLGNAMFYHCSALAALRKVEEVWGCECEMAVAVRDGRVSARSVNLVRRLGADRGLRLEYGRNMAGCTRTVLEDEVYTALYGWGAGLPIVCVWSNKSRHFRR